MKTYEVELNSRGTAGVERPPTKAAAVRRAKELAREYPGQLVTLYSAWYPRGSIEQQVETRLFRYVNGRVVEM